MKRKTVRKIRIVIAVIIVLTIYIWFSASKLIVRAAGEYFAFSVSNSAYASIDECIKNNYIGDFCRIERDTQGAIKCIKTDALQLNTLSVMLATECYNRLESIIENGFYVPSGVFTGIRILSGQGGAIKINLAHILSVQCDMVREFISAGINQTRLLLTVVIHANINVYTPLSADKFDERIEVPIFDTLIIGDVPNVYLSAETIGSWKKT